MLHTICIDCIFCMSFQLVQNILYGSRHHLTFMIAGVNTFTQEIQKLIHAEDKQKVIMRESRLTPTINKIEI